MIGIETEKKVLPSETWKRIIKQFFDLSSKES